MPRVLVAILPLALVLWGCAATAPSPTPSMEPSPTASPTASAAPTDTSTPLPPASPTPLTLPSATPAGGQVGLPSASCVNGWQAPPPGSALYDEALAVIDAHMTLDVPIEVEEMRYFSGPDVPWIIEPHYELVERWYVRTGGDMPAAAGRWLIEMRSEEVKGVSAVAPFDTRGFQSPDWTGFVGDGSPTIYPGLPGVWSGIAYDFVTGEGDSGNPGLPAEVAGCLADT